MSAPGEADDAPVHLLDATTGPILSLLHPAPGRWAVPDLPPRPASDSLPGLDGSGVTVVVVDTGVHPDHPLLRGRVDALIDLTGTGAQDRHGHGTAVAAILAASSPGARIVSIKALQDDGSGPATLLAAGIVRAGLALPDGGVVNVSAGRRTPGCTGACVLCQAVASLPSDVIVCAAAGNDPGATYCPARSAISVGAGVDWDADAFIDQVPPGWRLFEDDEGSDIP